MLEERLRENLRRTLVSKGLNEFSIKKSAARFIVVGPINNMSVAESCARVFGVSYAAPGVMIPAEIEHIRSAVLEFASKVLSRGQSFAIRAHRSTTNALSRRDVEVTLGSDILQALRQLELKVDLENPDVTIFVDLAEDSAFIYSRKIRGPAGLPTTSRTRMLVMLDTGPLAILAAYAMMRRGCLTEPFIPVSEKFELFKPTVQFSIAKDILGLMGRPEAHVTLLKLDMLLYSAPYLGGSVPGELKGLIRRVGLSVARERRFDAVVVGDVRGKVYSRKAAGIPVLNPLIGLSWTDLREMADEVGSIQNLSLVGSDVPEPADEFDPQTIDRIALESTLRVRL